MEGLFSVAISFTEVYFFTSDAIVLNLRRGQIPNPRLGRDGSSEFPKPLGVSKNSLYSCLRNA
jgi:hypothetical protein